VGVACGEGVESLGGLVQRQDVGDRVHDRFDRTWPGTSCSNEASYDRNWAAYSVPCPDRGGARRLSVGNWQLDPYHTQVEFSAKHLGMMTVRGYFDELSTVADIDPDHPETSSVEATISTASLRTNNGIRDNDIKSSNFLEVDKYPFIKFKSTSVEPSGQDHYKLTGDLSIKETTRPVVLDVVKYGEFNDPGMMGHRISYGATTKINRKNFGLSFNAILDGRMVVSEEIQITIEGELVEQAQAAEATSN
jgi:polyisoprenoid-binding protein YceI